MRLGSQVASSSSACRDSLGDSCEHSALRSRRRPLFRPWLREVRPGRSSNDGRRARQAYRRDAQPALRGVTSWPCTGCRSSSASSVERPAGRLSRDGLIAGTLLAMVRAHTTAEARALRRFESRRDAYRGLSVHLERVRLLVTSTEPGIMPTPDPPQIEADEAWLQLGGLVSVTASDEVRTVMRETIAKVGAFIIALDEYKQSQEPEYVHEAGRSPRSEMHEARKDVLEAIEDAQTLMRDELDAL